MRKNFFLTLLFSLCGWSLMLSTAMAQTSVPQAISGPAAAALLGADNAKLPVSQATASESQPNEGADKSIDGNPSSLYHSPHSGIKQRPIVLTYTLRSPSHVDYVRYVPRATGVNGNFGQVKVLYSTASAPTTFTEIKSVDLGMVGTPSEIHLGDKGVDQVHAVRLEVSTGKGGFVSCAEMEFYDESQKNTLVTDADFAPYFVDALRTQLRTDITAEQLAAIPHPYVKHLAQAIKAGTYSTHYRIGAFGAFEPRDVVRNRLRMYGGFDPYENATGIYFAANTSYALFVEGLGSDGASLIIRNFGPGDGQRSFALKNGLNIITTVNRGNGYISYFTPAYATAPEVKIHFVQADETGYFKLGKTTDAEWQRVLANATSDIMDVVTPYVHAALPVTTYRETCPTEANKMGERMRDIIQKVYEFVGLGGNLPRNRVLIRHPEGWGGYIAAMNGGEILINNGPMRDWMQPNIGIWAFAHEVGHLFQLPGRFNWQGTDEVTVNVPTLWAQYKLSDERRLELDNGGMGDYAGMAGGIFNTYLQEYVNKGSIWGLPPIDVPRTKMVTIKEQDYAGNNLSTSVTVPTDQGGVFVSLAPLWQLQLIGDVAGIAPDLYHKTYNRLRRDNFGKMSNGMWQMNFMKTVCEETQLNFLPFFEKAGMLKPFDAVINDYDNEWVKISPEMIQTLKDEIAAKGYPTPVGELNYISANNVEIYREKLQLNVPANSTEGISVQQVSANGQHNTRIRIQSTVYQHAVAYETYDKGGKLLRISMLGLGDAKQQGFTDVIWPETTTETAAYIMAVGYDGERKEVYRDDSAPARVAQHQLAAAGYVGGYDTEDVATVGLQAAYEAYQENKNATTLEALREALSALATYTPIAFDPTHYYYIKNVNTGLVAYALGDNKGSKAGLQQMDPTNASQLWQQQISEASGIASNQKPPVSQRIDIRNANANRYMTFANIGGLYSIISLNANKDRYTFLVSLGENTALWYMTLYRYYIHGDNNKMYVITADQQNGTAAQWRFKEAKQLQVNVSAAGYSTRNLPFAVRLPSEVKAYTALQQETDRLLLRPIPTDVVPANTPFIIEAPEGSYQLDILPSDVAVEAIDAAPLRGVLMPTEISVDNYVLATVAGQTAFYRLKGAGQLAANRAFLPYTVGAAHSLSLWYTDDALTGIQHIQPKVDKDIYYNLQGHPVLNPTKGIYINGRGEKVFFP